MEGLIILVITLILGALAAQTICFLRLLYCLAMKQRYTPKLWALVCALPIVWQLLAVCSFGAPPWELIWTACLLGTAVRSGTHRGQFLGRVMWACLLASALTCFGYTLAVMQSVYHTGALPLPGRSLLALFPFVSGANYLATFLVVWQDQGSES